MSLRTYRYVKRPVKPLKIKKVKKNKGIKGNFFPIILCIIGVGTLSYAVYPYAQYYFETGVLKISKQKEILVPKGADDSNVLGAQNSSAGSNDSVGYFQNASSAIDSITTSFQRDHPEYSSVTGEFYLTIDKIKLNHLPTKINVESSLSTTYLNVLKSSLAHFKGSSLPGKPGNTFVYGHSARGNIFGNNYESVFSGLGDLDVGDQIKIDFNGVEYKYIVSKWKITLPTDTSVVLSNSDRQTLTLMTCWPPGIGTERLIINADRLND
jgi:LPXTG-site transpeptidase (sortase) family protein